MGFFISRPSCVSSNNSGDGSNSDDDGDDGSNRSYICIPRSMGSHNIPRNRRNGSGQSGQSGQSGLRRYDRRRYHHVLRRYDRRRYLHHHVRLRSRMSCLQTAAYEHTTNVYILSFQAHLRNLVKGQNCCAISDLVIPNHMTWTRHASISFFSGEDFYVRPCC
jgi:hypothetical protein